MSTDWFWEGNVVTSVIRHLEQTGWTIQKVANTETREAGVDIQAEQDARILLIEVKGYPSKFFARGVKQGQPKKTMPSTQARHWYSEVLLSTILHHDAHPTAIIAIAVPDFPVFTKLISRTRIALHKLDIHVYVVYETGRVERIPFEKQD